MYRKEVNAQSPLRILEASLHGGLGRGNLGVIMARAGVGKTACLIQFALDDLLRDRKVLHVAIGQTIDHVQAWYDALFDDLAEQTELDDREAVRQSLARNRMIQTYAPGPLDPAALDTLIQRLAQHVGFLPDAILIDDHDWQGQRGGNRELVSGYKAIAERVEAELWMTAQTHREQTGPRPSDISLPCERCADLIDVALFLEPDRTHVHIVLLKDHDNTSPIEMRLCLHADTLRITRDEVSDLAVRIPGAASSLLSGGAPGAEEAFGAQAQRWGLREINFSFAGKVTTRQRGIRMLSDAELSRGRVSDAWLQAHLRADLAKSTHPEHLRRVLESIWHQVNPAGEVFVVGTLRQDGSVSGGTGWAVELARHWRKGVCVYDQEQEGWFTPGPAGWQPVAPPTIRRSRFTGTGTRHLNAAGEAAIVDLFERSFG